MTAQRKGGSHVRTDDEVELFLNNTLEYNANKTWENATRHLSSAVQ